MNKLHALLAAGLITASAVTATLVPVGAADTSSDPLVTMSYVEEVLAPRLKSELTTYIQNNFRATVSDGETSSVSAGYSIVQLTKGQTLYALSPTEVILRSGKAAAVSAFMDQGVNDMTDGSELYNGDELPRYHYCLIPRGDDGRGVVAVSDEIYIMVRGDFEIRE